MHRCLQRYGLSRLAETGSDKPAKQPFKAYLIGYFHIDIAEVRTERRKLHLFEAIRPDFEIRLRPFARGRQRQNGGGLLEALIAAVPYKIPAVLTDNGVQFCDMPQHRSGPTALYRLHNVAPSQIARGPAATLNA
ncbi:hypothetical protein BwSH20_64220 [Bradyrhizobium ottawaense]|nr:hypothetical protein TM233_20620 [Bradyrhizobium sp. TM233]GMO63453.1 hypothetical protein BwSG10_13430 [Bradyrhizobium ottawaense]GMO94633.1 hypothetical protein BwDG23_13430 [Bradyrhizobium ottawaense]GMP10864.1 hypothetical protein BwSH20_64220 [Bradyrhizobium ottawaense]GMP20604.1 hypothetical protein BwSH12_66100 [Bradyrhizobium ottawaense]